MPNNNVSLPAVVGVFVTVFKAQLVVRNIHVVFVFTGKTESIM